MAQEDPPGEVVLVRHGQTAWSAAHRHTGTSDVPLLAEGEEAARLLAPALARRRQTRGEPALVLSSPLRRARRTAELAGLHPEVEPSLAERDYGGADGRTLAQLREDSPGLDVWRDLLPPTDDGTPAETVDDLARRVAPVARRAWDLLGQGDVVLVAHGHSLRALTAVWLGLPPSAGELFDLRPAHLSTLSVHHEVGVVSSWNVPPGAG